MHVISSSTNYSISVCTCGNTIKYSTQISNKCKKTCTGTNNQLCGDGTLYFSVYTQGMEKQHFSDNSQFGKIKF